MDKTKRPVIIWLFTGCLLIYAMVVIGGITRLTHSGLSIADWSFMGSTPPVTNAEWQTHFNVYKQTPEFKLINNQFTLNDFKNIFWWEYIHRSLARIIGIVFIIPFFYFLLKKKFSKPLLYKLLIIVVMGALQGLLGWYMVSSGLIKNPHVSHVRLAAHLLSAFTVFGFTFWVALDEIFPNHFNKDKKLIGLRNLAIVLFGVLVVQIMYGAFVAGLKAGYYDPTFPKMGNQWIDSGVTALTPWYKNFIDGIPGVQFVHRYNAYLVVILVVAVWLKTKKILVNPLQKKAANALLILVFCQFLLGVFTLMYSVPVVLGVLHQTGAFFLFGTTLFFIHQLRVAPQTNSIA